MYDVILPFIMHCVEHIIAKTAVYNIPFFQERSGSGMKLSLKCINAPNADAFKRALGMGTTLR